MRYADYTRNTKEPLKRIAHGTRLRQAATFAGLAATDRVLDYGCGDGALFDELELYIPPRNLCGFDPGFLTEMERSDILTYDCARRLVANHQGEFDTIFCLEVCEHLTDRALNELFLNLKRLGRPGAKYVFGVPIETGLSGFAKNVYRTFKGRRQGATWGRAFRSLFRRPIEREALASGWIGSHLGFDSAEFAKMLARIGFVVEERRFLPWPRIGRVFNNEIYFICRLNEAARVAAQVPVYMPPDRLAA